MNADVFLHPIMLRSADLIARLERETGRRAMWRDDRRAALETVHPVERLKTRPDFDPPRGAA